jgi:hypothetical protein
VPEEVSERYPGVDHEMLSECRILMHAMIAAWRWDRDDQFPNGRQMGAWMLPSDRGPASLRLRVVGQLISAHYPSNRRSA